MPRFPGEGFRTGAFRTAAAFAILLLAAVAAASLFPADPSFAASHETQAGAPNDANPPSPTPVSREGAGVGNPLSDQDVIVSISPLFFAIIFMGMIIHGFRKHIREKSGEIERIGIATVLVVGALYLIAAGFTADNVAPAFALLGTIAGYLLGQIRPRKCQSDRCREVKTTDEKDA